MEELTYIDGVVHSLIYQNPENGYTVLRLISEEGELITVVGCIPCAAPGEHLALSGVWEQHAQHGRQLKAEEIERRLPEEEEEIESYLASGICKGVGPATARAMVQRFGRATLADGFEGNHPPAGAGAFRKLSPAHGAAASDGLFGPV